MSKWFNTSISLLNLSPFNNNIHFTLYIIYNTIKYNVIDIFITCIQFDGHLEHLNYYNIGHFQLIFIINDIIFIINDIIFVIL